MDYKSHLKVWCERHRVPMPKVLFEVESSAGVTVWTARLEKGRTHSGATKRQAEESLCRDLVLMVEGKEPAVLGQGQPSGPKPQESTAQLYARQQTAMQAEIEVLKEENAAIKRKLEYCTNFLATVPSALQRIRADIDDLKASSEPKSKHQKFSYFSGASSESDMKWPVILRGHASGGRAPDLTSEGVEPNPGPSVYEASHPTAPPQVLFYGDDFAASTDLWLISTPDWVQDLTEEGVEPNPGPALYWHDDGLGYTQNKYFPICIEVEAVPNRVKIAPANYVKGNWKNSGPFQGEGQKPKVLIGAKILALARCPHCGSDNNVRLNVAHWKETDAGTQLYLNVRILCSTDKMSSVLRNRPTVVAITVIQDRMVYRYILNLKHVYGNRGTFSRVTNGGRPGPPRRTWRDMPPLEDIMPEVPISRPSPVKDLTEEGVEPNPGPRKTANAAKAAVPAAASAEKTKPKPRPEKGKAKAKVKGGTRGSKKSMAINKSVGKALSEQAGTIDALRAVHDSGIPCRDYAAGNCTYGPACRFNHDVSSTSSSSTQAPAICRRFSRPEGCPWGAQCRYSHTGALPSAVSSPAMTVTIPAAPLPKIHRPGKITMQAGGALTPSSSISSTPLSQSVTVLPSAPPLSAFVANAPSPQPAAPPAAPAIIAVVPNPGPPALKKEMEERQRRERAIRRRLNTATKLVFYERVGVSNPLTALVLLSIASVLTALSFGVEALLAALGVEWWGLTLLFTIPIIITCTGLAMVCLIYLTAGTSMIRHKYLLFKNPKAWMPDADLRTDLGATSRLDHDSQRLARFVYTRAYCFTHDEKSNRKRALRYRAALAWENFVRSVFFMPKHELATKSGEYSEELLSQCTNAHNMSFRSDLATVTDRVDQTIRTKASMPLNRFDQTSGRYVVASTGLIAIAVWMDQQRSLRHLPFVVAPSLTKMSSQ